jgi:hypothetical protein
MNTGTLLWSSKFGIARRGNTPKAAVTRQMQPPLLERTQLPWACLYRRWDTCFPETLWRTDLVSCLVKVNQRPMPIPSSAGSWRHPLLSATPLRLPKLNFDLRQSGSVGQRKLKKIMNACGRKMSRDSVVGIATSYGLDDRGVGV